MEIRCGKPGSVPKHLAAGFSQRISRPIAQTLKRFSAALHIVHARGAMSVSNLSVAATAQADRAEAACAKTRGGCGDGQRVSPSAPKACTTVAGASAGIVA
jgi:hypothetical protein